jgi:hypothetical protein
LIRIGLRPDTLPRRDRRIRLLVKPVLIRIGLRPDTLPRRDLCVLIVIGFGRVGVDVDLRAATLRTRLLDWRVPPASVSLHNWRWSDIVIGFAVGGLQCGGHHRCDSPWVGHRSMF